MVTVKLVTVQTDVMLVLKAIILHTTLESMDSIQFVEHQYGTILMVGLLVIYKYSFLNIY